MLCYRCDESTSDVNFERCLEEYLEYAIGSSLRPGRLGISTRVVILIRTHTKKYTKDDSIKKFFAGYVGRLIRTIC